MSYHAGIGPRLGHVMGTGPTHPHISCDGCGVMRSVETRGVYPAQWFLDGRPPPRWKGVRYRDKDGNIKRVDVCPQCQVRGD